MQTFLIIFYTLHCILNYYGNLQHNPDMGTIKKQLIVVFSGFYCTPASLVILFTVIFRKTNSLLGAINGQHIVRNSYIFSTIVNACLIFMLCI